MYSCDQSQQEAGLFMTVVQNPLKAKFLWLNLGIILLLYLEEIYKFTQT